MGFRSANAGGFLRPPGSPVAGVRRPYRQGASEQTLARASDDVVYTDSGAPAFEFAGLEVEDWVASGADVGAPHLRDSITGARYPTTGLPAVTRQTGLGPCTNTDKIENVPLIPSGATEWTWIARMTAGDVVGASSRNWICSGPTSGSAQLAVFWSSGEWQVILKDTVDSITIFMGTDADPALPETLVITYTSVGELVFRLFLDGTLVETQSASGDFLDIAGAPHTIGEGYAAGNRLFYGTGLVLKSWGRVLTGPEITAVGTTATDPGDPSHAYLGLESGVFNPTFPDELPIGSGAGLPPKAP